VSTGTHGLYNLFDGRRSNVKIEAQYDTYIWANHGGRSRYQNNPKTAGMLFSDCFGFGTYRSTALLLVTWLPKFTFLDQDNACQFTMTRSSKPNVEFSLGIEC
jgi:hypothetical protein